MLNCIEQQCCQKRALHDEVRREGDERIKRIQEVAKEISGWKYRLETAEKRNLELVQRQKDNKEQLQNALAEPERLSKRREEISNIDIGSN